MHPTPLAALAMLSIAAPLAAQDRITPDRFLDHVQDRTAQFTVVPDGQVMGWEQFIGRDRVIFQSGEGFCSAGRVRAQGAKLCFLYDEVPDTEHCWWPRADGDRLFLESDSVVQLQEVTRLTDTPLSCAAGTDT